MIEVMKTKHGITSVFGLRPLGVILAALLVIPFATVDAKWIEKPKPRLPYGVYNLGLQGSVVLSLVMNREGIVVATQVLRSSGYPALDQLARDAAMGWRLSPDSVLPTDMTQGRAELITFRNPPPTPKSLIPGDEPYWAQVTNR